MLLGQLFYLLGLALADILGRVNADACLLYAIYLFEISGVYQAAEFVERILGFPVGHAGERDAD